MTKIFISLRTLPDNKRYVLISKFYSEKPPHSVNKGGKYQVAAIYKRYLSIFYIRVSPVYTGHECLTIAVNEYEKLTKHK